MTPAFARHLRRSLLLLTLATGASAIACGDPLGPRGARHGLVLQMHTFPDTLVIHDPVTGAIVRTLPMTHWSHSFVPSPSGDRIAAAMESAALHTNDLVILDLDGEVARRLGAIATTDAMAWSADGSRIVISQGGYNSFRIFPVDGSASTEFAFETIPDYATWSPSLDRIAYVDRDGLWLLMVDGRATRRLAAHDASGSFEHPAWSPDGRELATTRVRRHPDGPIERSTWIVSVESGDARAVTPWASGDAEVWPSWSPGGDRLAFRRYYQDGTGHDVYTVNVDGTGLALVARVQRRWWVTLRGFGEPVRWIRY